MDYDPLTSLASLRAELENGWRLFDETWNSFQPADWTRKFGKSWTYAEIPWHLAYFDGIMAKYLAYGPNVPDDDQLLVRSMGQLNEWNRREFARRAPGHTVQDSLKAMHETRDTIRRQLSAMTDRDLDTPAWMPLIFGHATKRDLLQAIVVHNVAEYWKLWIRTGKRGRAPSPAAVHKRLAFMMAFMPVTMNRELAAKTPFTAVWTFDGPGGGSWTFAVANGTCTVTEAAAPRSDIRITMKPETFQKLIAKMTPPPLLMLTGQMKVKGLMAMGTFGKLFPEPRPEEIIEPSPGAMAIG